jgi:hypothetical protein
VLGKEKKSGGFKIGFEFGLVNSTPARSLREDGDGGSRHAGPRHRWLKERGPHCSETGRGARGLSQAGGWGLRSRKQVGLGYWASKPKREKVKFFLYFFLYSPNQFSNEF